MIEPVVVKRPEDIGLDRHAVIEASAGTGKTYTIENIVLRLIRLKVDLDKILVVTFTEKATGELKERIRGKLIDRLAEKSITRDEKNILTDSLETFDNIHIFTIHGFCHRVLRQYAFENGEPFSWKIQDDTPIYEKMLKDQMRKDWRRWFGPGLENILRISGFSGREKDWITDTIRLARAYYPEGGDRMIPSQSGDPGKLFSKYMHKAEAGDEEIACEIKGLLRASTVAKLKAGVASYKREHNLASFDDMLKFVERSLDVSGMLAEELRKRYTYCLVDEFQDTDRVQWNIFKRVFLGSGNNRLFVIGDPKQAIYSFRNADVYAYIDAKREMIESYGAAFYALSENWRSNPSLIDAFNRLFGDGEWFPEGDMEYRRVCAPSVVDRKTRLYTDKTDRAAITAVDLSRAANGTAAQARMAAFIADEIAKLLKDRGSALVIGDKKTALPLAASDICILVKARRKADLIEKFLKKRDIPCSFYKKRGLYQSEEASHIAYLLDAIADPSDMQAFKKAMLTPFFGLTVQEVEAYAALPPSASLKELFQRWFGYAASGKWPELFRSIIEDTGVYYRVDIEERRMANYRHILENLQTEAISGERDIVDLIAALERYRKTKDFDDETFDMHRLETERPKVRIMTIHAAKGLEYPVVFVADGFSDTVRRPFWKYHDKDHKVVYDLAMNRANEDKFREEIARENRELYYVAMTRSKYKLYIPYFPGTSRSKGPLSYIVRESLDKALRKDRSAGSVLRIVDPDAGREEKNMPKPELDKLPFTAARRRKSSSYKVPSELFPGEVPSLEERMVEITSYSGLKRRMEQPHIKKRLHDLSWITYYDGEGVFIKEDDDIKEGVAIQDAGGGRSILPSNNMTGSMLHEIFEAIDFAKVGSIPASADLLNDAAIASLINKKLLFYGLVNPSGDPSGEKSRAMAEETASIVWNTINTAMGPEQCKLALLKKEDRLHELEFYYPIPGDNFLMGYIDLLFRFKDKYFILDWKSNYLENGYSPDNIKQNMEASGYGLQYKVYAVAVYRHLKACIKNFDFHKNFAGIYYIYLRGMKTERPDEGYFFTCPKDEQEIRAYEDEIFKIIGKRF